MAANILAAGGRREHRANELLSWRLWATVRLREQRPALDCRIEIETYEMEKSLGGIPMTFGRTRGFIGAALTLSVVVLVGLTPVVKSAPLTPGNVVVAYIATSQSTTSPPPPPDATQITLVEYN